jgi:hypothetical protein
MVRLSAHVALTTAHEITPVSLRELTPNRLTAASK